MPNVLPQRTCVACRSTRAKRELVRVLRSPAGSLTVDLRGKAPGRGAYLCPEPARDCLERGVASGAIAAALKATIEPSERETLREALHAARAVRLEE
ncbi:MAG: YlxR family protein [Chloroflexi bacterium]|nr:YlxR family protein [Chloroflexota bacterium]